jgi:hypothetical protein
VGTSNGQLFSYDFSSSTSQTVNVTSQSNATVTALLKLSSGLLAIGYSNNMFSINSNQSATSFVCDGTVWAPVVGLAEGHDGLLIVATSSIQLSFWTPTNCSQRSTKDISEQTSIVTVQTTVCPDNVNCMLIALASQYVYVYNYDNQLYSPTFFIMSEITTITSMAVFGSVVVTGGISGAICTYNLTTTSSICFTGHSQSVLSIQQMSTLTFATLGSDNRILFWNLITPSSPCTTYANLSVAFGVAASAAKSMVYLSSSDVIIVTYAGGLLVKVNLSCENSLQYFNMSNFSPYDYTASVQFTILSI